jgi:hypothetical protein
MALAAMIALASAAQAASVNDLIVKDGVHFNTASDESAEYVGLSGPDGSGSYLNRLDATRILSVGDVLRGIIDMNTIGTIFGSNDVGASGNSSWQAAFSTKVISMTDADGDGDFTIVFGPDPDFAAWLSELHTTYGQTDSTIADPVKAGTVARFFTEPLGAGNDSDLVVSHAGSPDANVATGTDGTFYWDLGFDGAQDVWIAFDALAYAAPGTSDTFSFANANFTLSVVKRGIGVAVKPHVVGLNNLGLAPATLVDVDGSISVRGDGNSANAGFHATDNAQFRFLAIVPLPTAVWPGFLLMAFVGVKRIRRRRVAA